MIKEKRLELGYTQDELANKLQIFKQQLSNIETGRIRMPHRHIKKISKVLKIPIDDLVRYHMENYEKDFRKKIAKT
jgi:transcriptional regulator with XRE-family HTH domain